MPISYLGIPCFSPAHAQNSRITASIGPGSMKAPERRNRRKNRSLGSAIPNCPAQPTIAKGSYNAKRLQSIRRLASLCGNSTILNRKVVSKLRITFPRPMRGSVNIYMPTEWQKTAKSGRRARIPRGISREIPREPGRGIQFAGGFRGNFTGNFP